MTITARVCERRAYLAWASTLLSIATAAHGETLRLPVVRDNWFSGVGQEAQGNNGGATRLKLKSIQELSLLDIDPEPLLGRVVQRATLHLRMAGSEPARRVTVSSFAAPWVEGTGSGYQFEAGSSTFNARQHPQLPWAFAGSDLTAVMLGQGGTVWQMADATPPEASGWQEIPVAPHVLAARVAGLSFGLLVFDDTGSEWTRDGEKFTARHFPNRFFYSRHESQVRAPYLTVELGASDREPPERPTQLTAATEITPGYARRQDIESPRTDAPAARRAEPAAIPLPAGEALVSWVTPADRGAAGTCGFRVSVAGRRLPQYLVPAAGKPGERVFLRLRDMNLAPGAQVPISVQAVDGAGNVGPAAEELIRVSAVVPQPLPGVSPGLLAPRSQTPAGTKLELGAARVAILDAFDKVHPLSGQTIPAQTPEYWSENHLFSASAKQVRLSAARNEFVTFQVVIQGAVQGLQAKLDLTGAGPAIAAQWSRFRYVQSPAGPLPDPLVPVAGPCDLPNPDEGLAGQQYASLLCEVYVPHEAPAGRRTGSLVLTAGDRELRLGVNLEILNFTLPDYLSFLPEMNCYSLPENETAYYRLAHRHRTVLNRVPYSQGGRIADGCAPRWDQGRLEWSAWDQRFGPLLDGSAFADLPRRGVPLEVFYLPLHENWPSTMAENYNGQMWADHAFREGYREAFVSAARQFAEHFDRRGWRTTWAQCFLNNKIDFKRAGWSRGSSPWLLDEPANFQDYWALRYFGTAFQEGVTQARAAGSGRARLVFRADISRPEWQRDALDPVLDYLVVGGGAFRRYPRLVLERRQQFGQVVVDYGTSNAIEHSNLQPIGWCLDSWTLGSDGVVPWQTIGNQGSWRTADQLALFYPGHVVGQPDPLPSIRLKAYCRGQQDAEYLTLLGQVTGQPRWAVGAAVREVLRLQAEQRGTGADGEDAGTVQFAELRPQTLAELRLRVGRVIGAAAPTPQRRLVDLRPLPSGAVPE